MKHPAEFLADIVERPEDDAPRLAYADWLDRQGGDEERDRAEFIRVQVELARLGLNDLGWQALQTYTMQHGRRPASDPGDPRVAELCRREQELWRKNVYEWRQESPSVGFDEVRRGFAQEACTDAGWFLRSGADLWRKAPVVGVRLYNVDAASLRRLGRSTHLARLKSLGTFNSRFGPDGAREFQNATTFGALGGLYLSGADLGPEGARAVAASPCLAGLRTLDLHANQILRDGAQALADSPHLGRLHALGVSMNRLRVGAVRALAASANLPNLKRLGLGMNSLHADAVEALAESGCLGRLTDLDLYANRLGPEGAAALAGPRSRPTSRP